MNLEQKKYYESKLAFEMDSADLYTALKDNENIVIVDGRSVEAYKKEHIPNAINFPHREISEQTSRNLDKSKLYICYCDGIGCNGSTKTALKLLNLGFEVKELIGGLDWWKRDGYETKGDEGRKGTFLTCGC